MKLQQLTYAIEISECGSINKAAQRLFISQPTLSSSMKELEKELGFMLFERSPQGIQVTKEGAEFIHTARKILLQVQHLRPSKSPDNEKYPPVLNISSGIYSFTTEAAIRFYKRSFENTPRFSLSITEVSRYAAVQDVINHTADIGIIHIKSTEQGVWLTRLKNLGLETNFLFKSNPCVTFRIGHPLSKKKTITRESILAYPQVCFSHHDADANNWSPTPTFSFLNDLGRTIYTNNPGTLYDLLSNTDAVFLGVTTYCITDFHPNLTTVPVPDETASWSIYYIKLAHVPLSPYASDFIDNLKHIAEVGSPIATTL